MSVNPAERTLYSRLGAHKSWANTEDRSARTAAARKAAHDRFEQQVDPEGKLPIHERAKRADHARKAYYSELALKSVRARRKKAS